MSFLKKFLKKKLMNDISKSIIMEEPKLNKNAPFIEDKPLIQYSFKTDFEKLKNIRETGAYTDKNELEAVERIVQICYESFNGMDIWGDHLFSQQPIETFFKNHLNNLTPLLDKIKEFVIKTTDYHYENYLDDENLNKFTDVEEYVDYSIKHNPEIMRSTDFIIEYKNNLINAVYNANLHK